MKRHLPTCKLLLVGIFLTLACHMSHAQVVKNLKTDFGAVGDGCVNDYTSLVNALNAVSGGGVLIIPEGVYNITSPISVDRITMTGDVKIVGTGTAVLKLNYIQLSLDCSSFEMELVTDAARGDREVHLVNSGTAAVLAAGSIMTMTCNTAAEPTWNYKKRDTHLIKCATIHEGIWTGTLETPLNFNYASSESGMKVTVFNKHSLNITGVDILVAGTLARFGVCGFQDSVIDDMSIRQSPEVPAKTHDGLFVYYCENLSITNITLENLRYGVLVGGSRNVYLNRLRASLCWHPVAPCNFSEWVFVNDLVGEDCDATMDSHPAFNVHFNNVRAYRDKGLSNLRSVGGSVRNSVFNSIATSGNTYMGGVAMIEMAILDDYDFLMENVEWNAPYNQSLFSGVGSGFGRRASFINVKSKSMVFGTAGKPAEVNIIACETSYLHARQPKMKVSSTIIDGDLFPETGNAGLMQLVHQEEIVFSDCTLKNAPYAVWSDWGVYFKRSFLRCSFKDIEEQFDHFNTNAFGWPGHNYTYWFDTCNFTNVAAYGDEISGSRSRVDACTFTGGAVLNPE
jgi:hypothetical protein